MTNVIANGRIVADYRSANYTKQLKARYQAERRFMYYGIAAIAVALSMLAILVGSVVLKGYTAFYDTEITMTVMLDPQLIDPAGTRDSWTLRSADYQAVMRAGLYERFPTVTGRDERRQLAAMLSPVSAEDLQHIVLANPSLIGTKVTVSAPIASDIDQYIKGNIPHTTGEGGGRVSEQQGKWLEALSQDGVVHRAFNWRLFANVDSQQPESAGILGAVVGSLLTMMVTLCMSVPIGTAAAVYLEEFAPKNRWTDLIEVNINNLAAVPSIVFGLLGLAVFLNFLGLPRSAPLVGGIVLALMTLPIIIIAARSALKAVPPSIREAALGIGASPLQVVTHHVLPLAAPGIMTGTIIGMAHALGETAPLLMIGMVAFVGDVPGGVTDPASVLPVQIYKWAAQPERGFVERTSAAIMILLAFLVFMNAIAIYFRKKFERRW
ncbi:MAG: phosphate ABC transporter permease PstA [Azospirillaceae bacterium]|nr:phosphate ABC transporter permease PstA [Azospirillaceae bacterium]